MKEREEQVSIVQARNLPVGLQSMVLEGRENWSLLLEVQLTFFSGS